MQKNRKKHKLLSMKTSKKKQAKTTLHTLKFDTVNGAQRGAIGTLHWTPQQYL